MWKVGCGKLRNVMNDKEIIPYTKKVIKNIRRVWDNINNIWSLDDL